MKLILKLILLIILLLFNYSESVSAAEEPSLRIDAPEEVSAGSSFEVKVLVNNAAALEGIDIAVTFTQALLAVIDADAALDGTQIAAGSFFEGLQAINRVDSCNGSIRLVAAQGDPGVSGNGAIAVINFRALKSGMGNVALASAGLADKDLQRITPALSSRAIKICDDSELPMVSIGQYSGARNSLLEVPVMISAAKSMAAYEFTLTFDAALLELKTVEKGDFLPGDLTVNRDEAVPGQVAVAMTGSGSADGDGVLCRLIFRLKGEEGSEVALNLSDLAFKNAAQPPETIECAVSHGRIEITPMDECFIATAAYGSKYTASVTLLRCFRDRYLLDNTIGRMLVAFYYRISPPVAAHIAQSSFLRLLTRILLAPVVVLVYVLMHPLWGWGLLLGGCLIRVWVRS